MVLPIRLQTNCGQDYSWFGHFQDPKQFDD